MHIPASEVAGLNQVRVERADEEVDLLGHVGVRYTLQVTQQ